MPRFAMIPALLLVLAVAASACGSAANPETSTPAATDDGPTASMPAETPAPTADTPVAGTDLDACEIVTPADVAAALDLDPADVAAGELTESPTSLSPGHTECRYTGDWGGLVVNLTPEDGANLYDAARGSYADASDREVAGADGAFWSGDQGRGFFWKGAVTVMLQFSHITTGADAAGAVTAIGQAAMDKVD
jgi:hypothetical protein